ncbi:hypothetical protein D1816_22785 [Aquimarina sp. AD10]|uniref:hypothetical protein n=1 Tax=Aquimarina sp. AD10 TaxID=1714849 RepID=UPI000E52D324|nr:hypothetical protein [Aquimarina sp. AD10]AXT63049.1 hypothetical protein D1816_22785 [Aquimarina sp. AD10]RKM96850.1 hypothetical protein D7033_15160 [Aquimarina sp. AD10]
MHKFTLIILLIIFNPTFGQEKDDPTELLITKFRSEMKLENISNFFIVKHITYSSSFLILKKGETTVCKPKAYNFNMYGFWKNGNETWIKKYDNCGGFNSIKLTDSKSLEFYEKNIDNLKKDEVKIYTTKADSIVNGKKYSYVSTRSHSPQRHFWFFKDSTKFQKKFNKYNLKTEKNNKNLNYESNNDLSIAKLNLICEEIIYGLEEKKMFNRLK